jgi:putative ABC transport system substrate-binding protein
MSVSWKPKRRCVLRRAPRDLCSAIVLLVIGLTIQNAFAQRVASTPRIGILSPYAGSGSLFDEDVKRGLMDLGYVEGHSIEFDIVFADGRTDKLPKLVSELVQRKVNVIITTTAPALRAAKEATTTIPIVIAGVDDAVEQGFVASLAKPSGNVTGISWLNADLSGKRLDLLKQAFPLITRIGILREAVASGASVRAVMHAAQALGVQTPILELRHANELDDAFSELARLEVGGLQVLHSPMTTAEANKIAGLASKFRLPAIYPDRSFIEAGGLMSYGPSLPSIYRRAAVHIDRILRGTKPADLPVEQPTHFELVVNLRSASLLGLSLSEAILVRADEVLE